MQVALIEPYRLTGRKTPIYVLTYCVQVRSKEDIERHDMPLVRSALQGGGQLSLGQWVPTPDRNREQPRIGFVGEMDELRIWNRSVHCVCVCCLLYTSPSPRDRLVSRMPSSA